MAEDPIQSYPLAWPSGWRRTRSQDRARARFSRFGESNGRAWVGELTVADGVQRVVEQLRLMAADYQAIISTNVPTRRDGLPRSSASEPTDPGVAVYWRVRGRKEMRCMGVDLYDRVADNLAAIAATLNAMRAIKRHGGAEILDRAFTGFKALPAPEQWWQVLGLENDAPTADEIRDAWLKLAKNNHPDVGGEDWQMARINDARDRGLQYIAEIV